MQSGERDTQYLEVQRKMRKYKTDRLQLICSNGGQLKGHDESYLCNLNSRKKLPEILIL